MIFGKLIGAILGYLVGGIGLALLGLIIGHLFDRGYKQMQGRFSPEALREVQDCFFTTAFQLLGHMAKADGRISEAEVAQTESYMDQLGLSPEHRREAITLFKQGADASFNPDATVQTFRATCGRHPNLVQMLVVYLVNLAMADGDFDQAEESVLRQVASGLGIPSVAFEQLLRMMRAQDAFRPGNAPPTQNALALAYEAIGVKSDASDAEIKRAYRKLMSQYHPDKLTGQGMPEDMVKAATERSQEIQAAYDTIKKSRAP